MHHLKYYMPHLELKVLELAELPLISININQGTKLKSTQQCLRKIYTTEWYTTEMLMFLQNLLIHAKKL